LFLTSIKQFEDAVFMLRWIAYDQLQNSPVPIPKLIALLQNIDEDLRKRVDPQEIQAKYSFSVGELMHVTGKIRGTIRTLPYEFAKWRVNSCSYSLSKTELLGVQALRFPLKILPYPGNSFSLELEEAIQDRLGNSFRVCIVNITRPTFAMHGALLMTLTVVADEISAIHTTPIGQLSPNDLVRSIDISLTESEMDPLQLLKALKEKFAPWPYLMEDVGNFWFAWLSCINLLIDKLYVASQQQIPQFNPSQPPAHFPHMPSLPPLPMLEPKTAFTVVESDLHPTTMQHQSDGLGTHHQGREQRPTQRRGHYRRKRGQGHLPNGELILVQGYVTKKEKLAAGVPLIGSRTVVG
jgi:hypothetical protein